MIPKRPRDSNLGAIVMHLHSLHKHRVDWINWLGERPLAFWLIGLLPALAIICFRMVWA
jgi:hypothetical protein